MSFLRGLKRICDISFYMTFVSFAIGISGISDSNLIAILPIFIVAAFLSAFLTLYGWIKYLGVIPLLLVFLIIPVVEVSLIILIPIMLYFIWESSRKIGRVALLSFNYERVFWLFIIALGVTLVFFMIMSWWFDAQAYFPTDSLLYALTFLVTSIMFMRMGRHGMDRHDESIFQQFKFNIVNTLTLVALVIGAVLVMLGNIFLDFILSAINFAWFTLVIPVTNLFIRLIGLILPYEINPISSFVEPGPTRGMRGYAGYNPQGDQVWVQRNLTAFMIVAHIIIFVLIIISIVKIVKFLSEKLSNKKQSRVRNDGVEEEYFSLGEPEKRKRVRNENQIREIYYQFLTLLKKKKVMILRSQTSQEVENEVVSHFESKKSSELRESYIGVRYGDIVFTEADVKRVKELYKDIKKEVENFS